MGLGEPQISRELRILYSLALLLLPFCLLAYRLLLPRLLPAARRLAIVMLAAQILVIFLCLFLQPATAYEARLWDINREFNLPSIMAAMQFATVAGVALLTACHAPAGPAPPRWHSALVCLVFALVALDEFFTWKSFTTESGWMQSTLPQGVAIVASTVIVAARSPRRAWRWHLVMLIGLAMIALGALVVDQLPGGSGTFGYMEEALEVAGGWLALAAALGHLTACAPAPMRRVTLALYLTPAISIALLLGYHLMPRFEMWLLAKPIAVEYESGLSLRGYRFDIEGESASIRLYSAANAWRWNNISKRDLGYSIHLIDQASGESIAQVDRHFSSQIEFLLFGEAYLPIYRDAAELNLPQPPPKNRALWLALTLWQAQGDAYKPKTILQSDRPPLTETQLALEELTLPGETKPPPAAQLAVFDEHLILDAAVWTKVAAPGSALAIRFDWRAEADEAEDYAQFLHLGHSESGEWLVFDQAPLGPRLPTRLWYKGMTDSETWRVPLPADLAPGDYALFTGLYRLRDGERAPAMDVDGAPYPDARAPLGRLTVESA